ncbi:MAG TPA: DUF58 domain-containing protein [Limnochordia bacterium]|nr:DUF58 domain-containing protein [Limnochordia bacterium]
MSTAPDALLPAGFMQKLDRLRLRSHHAHDQRLGEHAGRRLGHGIDFADYREYQPGDDFRHIDWNIYSRLDRLFVRLFAQEQTLHVDLYLDCSASMRYGEPDKFLYAQRLAAALGYIALREGARVGVSRLMPETPVLRVFGRRNLARLFAFLSGLDAQGPTTLAPELRLRAAEGAAPGLCVVISDLLTEDDWRTALSALVAQRKEVHLLHLLAPDELKPGARGRLALIDAETAERFPIAVDDMVLETYAQVAAEWLEEIQSFARAQRIAYYPLTTGRPVEALVTFELRRGGLLQ